MPQELREIALQGSMLFLQTCLQKRKKWSLVFSTGTGASKLFCLLRNSLTDIKGMASPPHWTKCEDCNRFSHEILFHILHFQKHVSANKTFRASRPDIYPGRHLSLTDVHWYVLASTLKQRLQQKNYCQKNTIFQKKLFPKSHKHRANQPTDFQIKYNTQLS